MGIGFDYPQDGNTVNSGGVLCGWGSFDSPILGIMYIEVTWPAGVGTASANLEYWSPAPGTWAFTCTGVPTDGTTPVTVKVVGGIQSGQQVPESITITCIGHITPSFGKMLED